MKSLSTNVHPCNEFRRPRSAGFTLIEFLIAMGLFLVIGGSVLALFAQHAPYFNRQQNLAGLNVAMQNAVSQMQLDLVNAGTGYYPGAIISSWPIGVAITNQPYGAGPCNIPASFTYTAACFDKITILDINQNIQPFHPTNSAGSTSSGTCSYITASPFYIQPNPGQTPAQAAASFNTGDQVILITTGGSTHAITGPTGGNSNSASSGTLVNSFVLSGPPVVGSNYVALPFTPAASPYNTGDPLDISTSASTNLGDAFCASDWVMKLEPTTYSVDVSTPSDPKLMRTQGGTTDIVAEQIIGFKVGAATWNTNNSGASSMTYSFYGQNPPVTAFPTPSGYGSDFEQVRSVRVTMIGRTTPSPDPTYTFRNSFDGGPYQVEPATVVINPRNLTMNSH
jgi:type II secretory pathway pseudopilin PulG